MSNIKKIAKGTAIYSITSVAQRGANFMLVPLFAIYFSTRDFGILGTVQSLTGFLDIFMLLGLNSAVNRFYYKYKLTSPEKIPTIWGTLYLISLLSIAVVLGISFTIGKPLIQWLLRDIPIFPFFAYSIIGSVGLAVFTIYLASLQARELPKQFAIFTLSIVAIQVALSIFFVVHLHLKAEGPLIARLLAYSAFALAFLYISMKEVRWTFDRKLAREIVIYIFPIIIHMCGGWLQVGLDRIILNQTSDTETVGVFHFTLQMAFPLTVLTGALINASAPWMARNLLYQPDQYKKRLIQGSPLFFNLIALIFLFFLEAAQWALNTFFNRKFSTGGNFVGILILGHFLQIYYMIFIQPLFVIENGSKKVPLVSIPAALFQSFLLFLLAPSFKGAGCAIAFASSMALLSILSYFFSQKHFPIRWKKSILMPGIIFFLYLIFQFAWPEIKWYFFSATTLLLVFSSTLQFRSALDLLSRR